MQEYGIVYKTQEPYEVLSTKWLDYDHVLKLKTVENMVEVYYNSGQFQNTLEYLEKFFPDAFSIYERLGSFYMEKGYGDVSHTRMRRYEILLEFLEDMPEISVDQVKDQMVYDLYLRENLKSRPGFARDQKPLRDRYGTSENGKKWQRMHMWKYLQMEQCCCLTMQTVIR